jgi:hypothetical protein
VCHVQNGTEYLRVRIIVTLTYERKREVRTGIPSFRKVATPFLVSIIATSCGVVTMTVPSSLFVSFS